MDPLIIIRQTYGKLLDHHPKEIKSFDNILQLEEEKDKGNEEDISLE